MDFFIGSMAERASEFVARTDDAASAHNVLPSADTAAMLFRALLASGQINMRRAGCWQTLAKQPIAQVPGLDPGIDLAA